MEDRMEKRRKEYQQDKMVYSLIGNLIKWGLVTWIGCSLIWWLVSNFI